MRIGISKGIFATVLLVVVQLHAADFTLKTTDKPAPKEISESIRAVLSSKAIQLVQGDKPALEIWLRQEIPMKSKPASSSEALNSIAETALVGVIAVNDTSLRDYKDNEIPKGLYTARFEMQPKDGDHLGTAEFDSFVVLTDAASDNELNGLNTFKLLTKASGKSTSSGHPLVVSLRPVTEEGAVPRITEPTSEHKAIRLKVPGKTSGGEKTDVVFDLVYQGHGHIQ